ncbi:hypothetical protein RD792_002018 [Penstemon davidsonii]|uniref:Uncharacterized protein n=1 Tax=Penstemon davidsonii TaxID=160366 RepID=A0ABR0DPX0_9LAMI|nr:hypothetical protein RD792_002018 [Penstemon davidsonii]
MVKVKQWSNCFKRSRSDRIIPTKFLTSQAYCSPLIMASLTVNQDSAKTVTAKGTQSLKIRGFSFTKGMGVGKYIFSDTFFVGGHSWEIRFYPDGHGKVDESGQVYVSCYIALVSKCKEGVEAYFEYVLLDQSGNKWHTRKKEFVMGTYMIGPHLLNDITNILGYDDFYKRTELEASQFIKDDCLTIQCTVGVVKKSIPLPLSDLGQIYGQLLESKEGSDVSFEVEGEIFNAHKLILSTRSPVFKAQFFGPLKEENTQRIRIEEMQAPVFKVHHKSVYSFIVF